MPPEATPEDPTAVRGSGVLLHVASLPGGRLGPEAFRFVDWLAAAGQSWWQVLPLTPPDRHGSPYSSRSAFAAWPGLLARPRAPVAASRAADFRERHDYWIGDWARVAGRDAVADQVRFEREWGSLRDHATARGVRIMGDLPFYVAPGAADVRAHPGLFRARRGRRACRPTPSATDGQLWGNPLVRLGGDAPATGYRWWIERLRRSRDLVDLRAHRPLPRLRRLLGRAAGRPDGAVRALAPGPRGRGGRGGARRAGPPGPGGRGPRRDHRAGATAARRPRPPGHARAAVRVRRRAPQPAPAREPPAPGDRLHRHPRQRHRGRLVERRPGRASAARRPRPPRRSASARTIRAG